MVIKLVKTTKKKEYLLLLKQNFGLKNITASQLKMSRQVVWQWEQKDPVFRECVLAIVDEMTDHVSGELLRLINSGNVAAIIFYLKCHGWREQQEQIISGGPGVSNIEFRFSVMDEPQRSPKPTKKDDNEPLMKSDEYPPLETVEDVPRPIERKPEAILKETGKDEEE